MFDQNDQNQQAQGIVQPTEDPSASSVNFSVPAVDPFASPVTSAPTVDAQTNDIAVPAVDPFASPTPTISSSPEPQADTIPAVLDSTAPTGSDSLSSIKQSALQNLSPLLDKLDQSPEEKFRTTMMLIQASDDQNLVQSAYDAANAIQDEKVRAQALLDVVNEINYFTQSKPAN